MRALVCGGRDYQDWETVNETLTWLAGERGIDLVIHGGARGADALAGEWAELTKTAVQVFKADWKIHGRAAGPLRNARMLEEARPDIVIAFPGGRGTADMVGKAKAAGLEIYEVI